MAEVRFMRWGLKYGPLMIFLFPLIYIL